MGVHIVNRVPRSISWRCLLCWGIGLALVQYGSPAKAQFGFPAQDIVAIYLFNGTDEASYRKQLEARTQLKIDSVIRVAGLGKVQSQKLQLAAKGDLNRFYRDIDVVRKETKGLNIQNQQDAQKAWEIVSPLQQRLAKGLLQEGSLFQKVLDSVLQPEQEEQYEEYLEKQNAARRRAVIRVTIADIERMAPLLNQQRQQLIRLLDSKKPPQKVPNGYTPYLGYIMLTRIKPEELEEIMDEAQLKVFKKVKQQYAAYARSVTW